MRFERWWWLYLFCLISLGVHVGIGARSQRLAWGHLKLSQGPGEMEVVFEPEPQPEPEKEAEQPEPERPAPRPAPRAPGERLVMRAPRAAPAPPRPAPAPAPAPAPVPEPEPEPAGRPDGRVAAAIPLENPTTPTSRVPDFTETPDPMLPPAAVTPTPRPRVGGPVLEIENPLNLTGPSGPEARPALPGGNGTTATLRGPRMARADLPAGGGSLAPGPIPGGRDGFRGPEQPDDGTLFTGGGAGGLNLPRATARPGAGGGRSFLSVDNPLAREAVSDDRPGIGPGRGGGSGTAAGGGNGFARGPGIGTDPNARMALATLRARPGTGIGAGTGTGVGTKSPGGGKGTGAELPGTGGTGFGYGRGTGTGIGPGAGAGRGTGGSGGPGRGPGGGRGDGPAIRPGGGGRLALDRGIPFGELSGLLRGSGRGGDGDGGNPRGTSRGTGGGAPSGRGASDPAAIVYVLDTSTSMAQGNKIGQAKLALKKALNELRRTDRFNIVNFDGEVHQFAGSLVAATPENMDLAMQYVDAIQLRPGTHLSDAMLKALAYRNISHVFLLSDGEPSRGVTNPGALRSLIRDLNGARAKILTLALGLGEQFPGISLLKGIADDNDGDFSYVNLAK